jgi:hypothetical protein
MSHQSVAFEKTGNREASCFEKRKRDASSLIPTPARRGRCSFCGCPCLFWLIIIGAVGHSLCASEPPKPNSHTTRCAEGWTVHVDDRLLAGVDAELGGRALRLLGDRLYEITLVMSADRLDRLRQVPIWLDRSHGQLTSMQYHPSRGWLKEHGYAVELARCVHIPDAARFASPKHQHEQPWAVLHELAHAYHDQVLGFDAPEIKAAWQRCVDSGRYTSVLHIDGRRRKHYALTNQKEFFAEMSEAYFGMNDFFPFNRAELRREEPEVFDLLRRLWGPLPGETKP